ncbi:hypothetical protein LCGC14_2725140 [marine sediment metagenome]|uniref:RlpA-like protein double-psi beta-barrel domain-containing protein n=1 Tax=marine sediment metagenome TaxID=412755 RepID=A0A0F8Z8W8_9ZZZZ
MIPRFLSWLIIFLLGTLISLTSLHTHLSTLRSLERIQEAPKAILQSPQVQIRASWYGPGYYGRKTASGEVFTGREMTAAHRDLPFGTLVELCRDGNCITVRVNDRGPYCEYPGSYYYPCDNPRDMDLSEGAAEVLGFKTEGVVTLYARYLFIPVPTQ